MKTVAAARRVEPDAAARRSTPASPARVPHLLDRVRRRVGSARSCSGPFLPAEVASVPPSLLAVDPALDTERGARALAAHAARQAETITAHLRRTCAARSTSSSSAATRRSSPRRCICSSVRESYRELAGQEREAPGGVRPAERARSPQVELPRHRLPRAPHAAHVDHRLQRDARRGHRRRRSTGSSRVRRDDPQEGRAAPRAHHEPARPLEARERHDVAAQAHCRRCAAPLRGRLDRRAEGAQEVDCLDAPSIPAFRPRGDAERLRQVFLNLVDNAIKFTPDGGHGAPRGARRQPRRRTHERRGVQLARPSRRMLEVRVIDTGIGIPEEERERIFDAFYQVDSSSTREYGGTGLGLSIVKRIVDAHGGRVFVSANVPYRRRSRWRCRLARRGGSDHGDRVQCQRVRCPQIFEPVDVAQERRAGGRRRCGSRPSREAVRVHGGELGKVKRIRNFPEVRIAPCDLRGNLYGGMGRRARAHRG